MARQIRRGSQPRTEQPARKGQLRLIGRDRKFRPVSQGRRRSA